MAVDKNNPLPAAKPYQSMADHHPAALQRVAENAPNVKSAEEIVQALTQRGPTAAGPAPTSHPNASAEELQKLDPSSRTVSVEDIRRLSELQAKRRASSQARPQ